MNLGRDFRTTRFWAKTLTQSFAAAGVFGLVAGLTDALFPDSLEPVGIFLLVSISVLSIMWGLYRSWPRTVQQSYNSPTTEICIIEGDLFAQRGHVIIGMTDTFDTAIPRIIDERSVQAQFLRGVYHNDLPKLDSDLTDALKGKVEVASFSVSDNKPGKQSRYELGTVAVLEPAVRSLFYCVAYTKMNSRNEARGTVDGVWRSLNNVWREVRACSNGEPVSIGVIGGGQARISQHLPPQDAIRLTAMSFMFASREERVTSRLNIIVLPSKARELDMPDLQSFLKSLRRS